MILSGENNLVSKQILKVFVMVLEEGGHMGDRKVKVILQVMGALGATISKRIQRKKGMEIS